MRTWTAMCVVVLMALCAAGCGKDKPTVDTAPFQAAVTKYLAAKNMGMKVAEFQSLEVEGNTATGVCRLEEASGLYSGVGVRWRFTFEREGGGWRAGAHEAL